MRCKTLTVGLIALVAACATTPKRNEQVEAARAEFEKVSQDPLAQQAASADIDSSRRDLEQADAALRAGRPASEVDQLGYLALRHAQAGEARVAEAHSREAVAQAQTERQRVMLEARERETQNARAQAEAAGAAAQSARETAVQSQAQLEQARASAQQSQAQLEQARSELEQLRTQQTARGRIMTLSSDLLFDTGQASVKPGASRDLERLAQFLKDSPQTRIMVEGFTDSRGSDAYNSALSERRARAVADALSERGVPPDRVQARGLGKGYPVASNDTPEGRQQNRRVEIVLSDQAGRFAQGADRSEQPTSQPR